MLSIIIPACNEEKYLENTINAIKTQNKTNCEIIVVCDGCNDKTPEIAKKLAHKSLILKKRKGPSIAKNEGAKIAKGKQLIFLDADTIITKGVLNRIEEILNLEKDIVGTCLIKPSNKKLSQAILK